MSITVNSTITLLDSFDGGGATYVHGPTLGDYPLFKVLGTTVPITLSNCIIDDNNVAGTYAAVVLAGDGVTGSMGNRITNCTLNNCLRYGFTVQNARDFRIDYNTVNRAQYGISGSSGSGVSGWGRNGVIEHNNIAGMNNVGIKCKAFDDVWVRYNYIDVTPVTSTPSKIGIQLSNDAPNLDVLIEENYIVRSAVGSYPATQTFGFQTDAPPNVANPEIITDDNIIRYNTFSNLHWGVYLSGDNSTVYNNTFNGVTTPITDLGTNDVGDIPTTTTTSITSTTMTAPPTTTSPPPTPPSSGSGSRFAYVNIYRSPVP